MRPVTGGARHTVDPAAIRAAIGSARRRGWAVGGATVGLWVLYRLLVDQLAPGTVHDLLRLAGDVVLCSSVVLGLRAYARALPSAGVIVWLRRFHARRSKVFGALLERAATGVGHPLTLQDSSYSASYTAASARSGVRIVGLILLWLPGALLVSLLVFAAFGPSSDGVLVIALIAFTAAFVRVVAAAMRRLGFRTIDDDAARQQLSTIIRARGRGRYRPALGVEVLKVRDAAWTDLVQAGLEGAVLAVLDVSEVTDNIRWELATALRSLGPERIILAVEEGAADPARIWRDVVAPVQDSIPLGTQWVASALFTYPTGRRPNAADPRFRRDVDRLRSMMAQRVAAGR